MDKTKTYYAKHFSAAIFADGVRAKALGASPLEKGLFDRATVLIQSNSFLVLQTTYGYSFVIGLLTYYERRQEFEKCALIKADIERLNKATGLDFSAKTLPRR